MTLDIILALTIIALFLVTVSYFLLRESPEEKTKP